ncbi:MAG: hypothetical protein JST04_03465 [Bdellovibrionales bacterium]|nr:hypothetical protein [Bdellovibrionales bacterium]
MKFTRSLLLVLPLLLSVVPSAFAGYEWGFADVSLNRLYWDSATKEKSTKTDFNYLELEGGGQFTWGEVYGFFDLEEIGKRGELMRSAAKGSLRYYLGKTNLSFYTHVYNFDSNGFSEQNRVYGLGYQAGGTSWWFKPFLGFHDVTQTYFAGSNGFMGGWVAGYSFRIGKTGFVLADWHEIEFARKDAYAAGNGNRKSSQNGALSAWWIATKEINVGLQWRYAVDKLGTPGALNAAIVSLKYMF